MHSADWPAPDVAGGVSAVADDQPGRAAGLGRRLWPVGGEAVSDEQKPKRKKPHPASLPGHPNYKPASGIPPGGDGYGPASGKPARAFTTEYRPDPELTEAGKAAARDLTLREMAIAERKANIETWKAIRDDPTAPHMARITAAAKLAERSDGMPAQMVDVTTRSATAAPIKSEDLDDVELDVLHDVLLRAVTKKGDE